MKEDTRSRARQEVAKVKTADDLNRLIARHLEILDRPGATIQDIRLAETISALIGRQVAIENVRIAYERLALANARNYGFVAGSEKVKSRR